MKKFLLSFLTLAASAVSLALFATDDTSGSDRYPVSSSLNDAYTDDTKKVTEISLTSPLFGLQTIGDVQNSDTKLIHPTLNKKFRVYKGETVKINLKYNANGRAVVVYIDLNNDGQFTFTEPTYDNPAIVEGSELASYTRHNWVDGWKTPSGVGGVNPNYGSSGGSINDLPEFKVPEATGTYKMRINVDWSSFDPQGSNTMNTYGLIADIDLEVVDYYHISAGSDAKNTFTHDTQPRYTNALSFNSPQFGSRTALIDQQSSMDVYYSKMNDPFVATPGETVEIVPTWSMNAMHSYIYVDLNNNGIFDVPSQLTDGQANGELLSYSFLSGMTKNSAGGTLQSTAGDASHRQAPAFTIPTTTQPGIYRLRYKVDWDNSDYAGSMAIGANGGVIIDVPLVVVDPATLSAPTISLTGTATNGTATIGEGINLNLTPAEGYTVGTLTASGSHTFTGADNAFGNPTSVTANFSNVQFNGPTIPASLRICDNVTVDVTNAFTAIPEHEGYTLVWNDEFNTADGTHPDMVNSYETPERYNAAWNRFISSREDLMVMNSGALQMFCKPNPESERTDIDDREMVSGAIRTRNHFSFKYGRAEARMRVEGHTGSFPAFWLMPNTQPNGWPTAGEIDIFESINDQNKAFATLHAGSVADDDQITHGINGVNCNIGEWHTYGVEWSEDEIKFFIDGVQTGTVITPQNAQGGLWPFNDQPFYLILNQSVGNGSWAANRDVNHTYMTEVDWVRVYQKTVPTTLEFVNADGSALDEQPTSFEKDETVYVKASYHEKASIAFNEVENLEVFAVDGVENVYAVTPKATGNLTLTATATLPSGITSDTSVDIIVPITITWTDTDKYYFEAINLDDNESITSGNKIAPGTRVLVKANVIQPAEELYAPYRIISYNIGNTKVSTYRSNGQTLTMADNICKAASATLPITQDSELSAVVEYLPKVTFPEGVTVVNGETAVTSGERFMKGTVLTATLSAVEGKKTTYTIPDEDDTTLYPGDEAATKTITIALKEDTTTDSENDIAITAETKDVKKLTLPDLSTEHYTLSITGEDDSEVADNSWIEAETTLTFTVTPEDDYTIDAATLGDEDMNIDETTGNASKVYTVTATDEIPMPEVTATRYLAVTIANDLENVAITLPDSINAAKIAEGTEVTATITAGQGYRITAITANGEDAELVDVDLSGKVTTTTYTFTVNDAVTLTATAEYMPTVTFPEGVTVAEGTEAITSGTRVIAGEISVTLSPIEGKKTTYTVPDEDDTILYPDDDAIEMTLNVSEDITITAVPTDVVTVTLPTIEGAMITTNPEGHNGYFDADSPVTFTVEIAKGYELEEDATPSIAGQNLDADMEATITLANDIAADAFIIPVKASVKMVITTPGEDSGIAVSTPDAPASIDNENTEVVFEAVAEDVEGHEDHGGAHTHLTIRHDANSTINLPADHKAKEGFEFVPESSNEDVATATIEEGKIIVKHNKRVGSAIIRIYHRAKAAQASRARLLDETPGAETTPDAEVEQPMATLYVDVRIPSSTAVTLEAVGFQTISISYGRTRQLAVALTPTEVTNPIIWTSTNSDIVTVDEDGLITAKAAGTTTVTASVDGLNVEPVTFTVTVTIPSGPIGSGIDAINADAEAGLTTIYDLQGRRLERIFAPGFYIVNGVKTLVK